MKIETLEKNKSTILPLTTIVSITLAVLFAIFQEYLHMIIWGFFSAIGIYTIKRDLISTKNKDEE